MTKLKQLTGKFDVLYSRENSPWIGRGVGGGYNASSAVEHCPGRILGKSECYRAVEEATEMEHD